MPGPAPLKGFTPRALISPSALRQDSDCRASWGRANLEGRRTPSVVYEELPPPPPKAAKGASAVEKERAKRALKAYNKTMRPSLGTSTHAIFEGYYLQKVPGAWHAPRLWINLEAAWHTRAGQIALTGRQHMPAPASLARVACEELVSVKPTPGWVGEWPRLGGTPDLVAQAAHADDCQLGLGAEHCDCHAAYAWHLYDYKTTLSFEYAKTAEELRDEDEQSAIYALAVMQEHGLSELECTWVYMRTEGAPASLPVHFTMTRAHAEARVAALAPQALELQRLTEQYIALPTGFLGDGQRLKMLESLPTDDGSCGNYGGCPFAVKAGGFCKPKKSGLGAALRKQGLEALKLSGRKQAAKAIREEGKTIMLTADQVKRLAVLEAMPAAGEGKRSFKDNQEMIKLRKEAAKEAPAEESADIEATGEEAPAAAEAPSEPKPAATKPAKASAPTGEELTPAAVVRAVEGLPKSSPLFKGLLKVIKAEAALEAARAGEL